MANIEQDLQAIMDARYGKDVRQSIHDAISDINEVNEANISTVQGIADTAQGYANTASQAKTDAQTAQTGAETAQTHAETAEDGAEHFYQETLAIAQTLGSALIPRGTVEFANLPSVSSSDIKDGYMWNISDPFTTTSDFVEGAGLSIPMGANVYRITINNVPKWDILAGSSAQVYTGTEAQIEQAIQQGLLGEGVMINSLDDGEDELLTTSMIYHHNESLEDKLDDVDDEISDLTDYLEGTFQRSSGTITANSLKKYGNTVNCVFVMSGNTAPIRTSIAVVPTDFRPSHAKFGMCTISITNGFMTTPIKIETDGVVSCPFASAESAPDIIQFAFEYNLG